MLDQLEEGNTSIRALMIESNIECGNQPIDAAPDLKYGVSVTDKCISWDETEDLLREIHQRLQGMGDAGQRGSPAPENQNGAKG